MNNLEETTLVKFDPVCLRKKANWSKSGKKYQFDSKSFDPEQLLNDLNDHSPKLAKLLKHIDTLDQEDKERDGHFYKHFIFCDLKSSNYGAKLLASAFIAKGFHLGYDAPVLHDSVIESDDDASESEHSMLGGAKKKRRFGKTQLLTNRSLNETKGRNFYLLSSVAVFEQPINVSTKKQILQNFNARPDNIHGDNVRFIIMDSGFKEGIDLFDIKYVHIFEPPVNAADQKQVIGRGTRTCGQKGLQFHPTKGWPLHVFIYDLSIPDVLQKSFSRSKTAFDLFLTAMNVDIRMNRFTADLEETVVYGSVDYELNRKIHEFRPQSSGNDDDVDGSVQHGGGKQLVVIPDSPIVITTNIHESKPMNFHEMREWIRAHFSKYSWTDVKMENACVEKTMGGGLTYTPTQDFVRQYFTPQAPVRGMLLYHSVGTGKTCSAIAAATSSFEPQGYTILWVTRTTLKNDIWKNMFDQICSRTIAKKMEEEGLTIPAEQSRRMKLLSKSWRIRPMSYKQFSNLVLKENRLYSELVKINGAADPLRKTLLIIDEAHKLYGGGDLSSIERPDMKALHAALMNSYAVSGIDSVRLLLMTATPITEDPMELVKLVNLCKPVQQQMPESFDPFAQDYLNEEGVFTDSGRAKFLDNIAGHVSYLNREKDARQFSQPQIKRVDAPIVPNIDEVMMKDKKFARGLLLEGVDELKSKIVEHTHAIANDIGKLDRSRFLSIRDKCDKYEDKSVKTACNKIANAAIHDLMNEAREYTKSARDQIKEIRADIKNKRIFQKEEMQRLKEKMKGLDPEELNRFKNGIYYHLKYKCGKTVKNHAGISDLISEDPHIAEMNQQLQNYDDHIAHLDDQIKIGANAHKNKLKSILLMSRQTDVNDLEKNVLKLVAKDIRKKYKDMSKMTKKQIRIEHTKTKKMRKEVEKERKKAIQKLRKTIKQRVKQQEKDKKQVEKAEESLRKTQRKAGELREEFQEGVLKEWVKKYSDQVDERVVKQMENIQEMHAEKARVKEAKQAIKDAGKVEKMRQKEEEKARRKTQKILEKQKKQEEKSLLKQQKKEEQTLRKTQKKLEKLKK